MKDNRCRWYAFDRLKGSRQKRPPVGKLVLVQMDAQPEKGLPACVAVGYRKNAAGDKQSPYFVVPGAGGGEPRYWCDCLPDSFCPPLWPGFAPKAKP